MSEGPVRIDIRQLRPGLFISLGERWIDHDFLFNSFRVSTPAQIAKIRAMGISHIDYWPSRSTAAPLDPPAADVSGPASSSHPSPSHPSPSHPSPSTASPPTLSAPTLSTPTLSAPTLSAPTDADHTAHRDALPDPAPARPARLVDSDDPLQRQARMARVAARRAELARCEQVYRRSVDGVRQLMGELFTAPREASERADALVGEIVADLLASPHAVVNLINDAVPDVAARHHLLNVTILSLLLGRVAGLDAQALGSLGLGALLHDLGKSMLPQRLTRLDADQRNRHEEAAYRLHVEHGLDMYRHLGMDDATVLDIIRHHHERFDGSGFPDGLKGEAISLPARIVAIANRFDNLCHPADPSRTLTPAEALAALYRREKAGFDGTLLQRFIKALGVWPPGTLVQLSNGAVGLVTAVRPEDTLRPAVMVGDPTVPRAEAVIVDLRDAPDVRIERALRPQDLDPEVLAYLSLRGRHPWFIGHDADG